jgi:hypothetical protein
VAGRKNYKLRLGQANKSEELPLRAPWCGAITMVEGKRSGALFTRNSSVASKASAGSSRWRPTASPVNKMELPLNSSFMTMLTALSFSELHRPDQSGWG